MMKTNEEKTQIVLTRIGQERALQRSRTRMVTRIAGGAMSLCLVAGLGFGIWQNGLTDRLNASVTEPSDSQPVVSPDLPSSGEANLPQPAETQPSLPEDTIAVNPMEGDKTGSGNNIALLTKDYIPMEADELSNYYGTKVFPAVPADLSRVEDRYGLYRREDGTIYYDTNAICYANADGSRFLTVRIASNSVLPFQGFLVESEQWQKSVLCGGQEIVLGQDSVTGMIFAGFCFHDAGFTVTGEGVSQEELVEVIRSLTEQ